MKKQNTRSLDAIADDIHELDRANIFDKGDLLIEAKAQCEHGQWLDWLDGELDYSVDTAERYMSVAQLAARFRNLRNLKLAKGTLYELSNQEDDDLPAIIAELAKHATKKKLRPRDAERVIMIGIGRHCYGDHPDATLVQLVEIEPYSDDTWHERAMAALKERKPETDEIASAIVDEIQRECLEAERIEDTMLHNLSRELETKDETEREAESILDGAPPVLPPSITPPDAQKLDSKTAWEGTGQFIGAVGELLDLSTKPATRFAGMFPPDELNKVADFLRAVAVAEAPPTQPQLVDTTSLAWSTTTTGASTASTGTVDFKIFAAKPNGAVSHFTIMVKPSGKDWSAASVLDRFKTLEAAKEAADRHVEKAEAV
jgi:Protein of unknown function (DUF3102)